MKDLQKKNDADLVTFVSEKREALRALRFSASGSGMRDAHAMRNLRKEIARGLTELNRRAKVTADA
ncbi:MAG: 50S ribosomal protein L29 [Candidatus Pacebacteria bacterium]|nr:50S ribosomal protein L29 [Candidatus Paceibacterota bacterium]